MKGGASSTDCMRAMLQPRDQACTLSRFSHVWLLATLWTIARQALHSPQDSLGENAKSGLPCPPSGDLPDIEIKLASLVSPAPIGGFFISDAVLKPQPMQGHSQTFWNQAPEMWPWAQDLTPQSLSCSTSEMGKPFWGHYLPSLSAHLHSRPPAEGFKAHPTK